MPHRSWRARPVLSALVRAVVLVLPAVVAVLAVLVLARVLPEAQGLGSTLAWWVVVIGVTIGVVAVVRRLARRLLPLSVLYRLSLVFPDRAPSRHRLALRAWSTRSLASRVAEAQRAGLRDDTTVAAELLVTLVAALGNHDARTRGHSERTRAYADLIAEELDLPGDQREQLRWAALLHDIGKLAVQSAVLGKDGAPDEAEWDQLRRHPDVGYELARPLHGFLGDFAETILHHHERMDGSGYPRGLVGDEINLGARIVAVADAFDAMTAARSYQPPRPPDAARRELAYRAGSLFDPVAVRALLNLSIGSIRWVMGPLAVLGALPLVGGLRRLGQAAGVAGTVAAGMVALAVAGPSGSPAAPEVAPAAEAAEVLGVELEVESLVIDVSADPQFDPSTVEVAAAPGVGSATLGAAGTVVYRARPGSAGKDAFAYRACRFDGSCVVGRLVVQVDPDNAISLAEAPPGADVLPPGATPSADGRGAPPPVTTTTTAPASPTTTAGPTTTTTAPTTTTTPTTTAAPTATTAPPTTTTTPSTTTTAPTTTTTTTTTPTTTTTTTPSTTTTTPTTTTTTSPTTTIAPTTTTTTTAPTTTTTTTPVTTTTAPSTTTTTSTTTTSTTTTSPDAPPTAGDDDATTTIDVAVTIDVLANDTDEAILAVTISIVVAPSDGMATPVGTMIEYVPLPGFTGEDRFTYRICDAAGQCAEADVKVTVEAPPGPKAVDDEDETKPDGDVGVKVLSNDERGDGKLAIAAFDAVSALGGTITLDPKGGSTEDDELVYTPPPGWDGTPDTFSYTVIDEAGATSTATVTITPK